MIARVWPGLAVTDNNLNVQIAGLRKLLGTPAVLTVPGRGFRFMLDTRELPAAQAAGAHGAQGAAAQDVAELARVVEVAQRMPDVERRMPKVDLSLSDAPSIAVLPFLNLGNDSQQDYFGQRAPRRPARAGCGKVD